MTEVGLGWQNGGRQCAASNSAFNNAIYLLRTAKRRGYTKRKFNMWRSRWDAVGAVKALLLYCRTPFWRVLRIEYKESASWRVYSQSHRVVFEKPSWCCRRFYARGARKIWNKNDRIWTDWFAKFTWRTSSSIHNVSQMSFRARQKRRSNTALFCYLEATNSGVWNDGR